MDNRQEERDYLTDMNGAIERLVAERAGHSGWVPALAADDLVHDLILKDSDLLNGWISVRIGDILRQEITRYIRQQNGGARRRSGKAAQFQDAARDFENATTDEERDAARERLKSVYHAEHTVDLKNTRKQACDMTGTEHQFVAEHGYRLRGNRLLMLAAFHDAVGEWVGDQRTGDVIPEEEYVRMFTSIVA